MAAFPPRRFHLLDAMVLVLATAVGFAWVRLAVSTYQLNASAVQPKFLPWAIYRRIWLGFITIAPCLMMWMLALSLLGLRRPRPRHRRLARQRGWIACVSASITMIVVYAWGCSQTVLQVQINRPPVSLREWVISLTPLPQGAMSIAVAAAWMTLLLTGQWRPEATWIDRAGRVLGVIWVGAIPLFFRLFEYP